MPYVVQETITKEFVAGFQLTSEANVHGIMQGEIFDMNDMNARSIELV